jgi:hypothetical protein
MPEDGGLASDIASVGMAAQGMKVAVSRMNSHDENLDGGFRQGFGHALAVTGRWQ